MLRYRGWLAVGAAGLAVIAGLSASCGGGDSGSSLGSGSGTVPAAANVAAVIVDAGPDPTVNSTVNSLFTTVTVCVPGSTTECQTIDHIQVDTQSYGLRIIASVLNTNLQNLSVVPASDGNPLVECTPFAGGYSWGPVTLVDFTIAGETASSLPIQLIGDSRFPASTVPADCSGKGQQEDTVAIFGANGILGIGVFEPDCGSGCSATSEYYWSCPASGTCTAVAPPTQVQNPVPLFAKDNDGTIIVLPAVSAPGAATLSGSLIFGIDTETNNASGTQTIIGVDSLTGEFTTMFNGNSFPSFIDSGTNGIFFPDGSITLCTGGSGFYCPSSTLDLNATLMGRNGVSYIENFAIGDADTLFSNSPSLAAIPTLGGTFSSSTASSFSNTFDWGLPFFYGRRFFTAIENRTTAVATGPYMAF
jgi:hypothetical protein